MLESKALSIDKSLENRNKKTTYNKLLFFVIVLLYILIGILNSWFVPFYDLLLQSITRQLTENAAHLIIAEQKKWAFFAYILIPVFLFIKVGFCVLTIEIGTIIFDFKVKFKQIVFIVLQAEFVFVTMSIVKLIWVIYFIDSLTYEYLVYFTPLALSNLFSYKTTDEWYIYPLQVINLFEVFYWILLSFLLSKKIKYSFLKTFFLILKTYVACLLMWVLFLIFLKL